MRRLSVISGVIVMMCLMAHTALATINNMTGLTVSVTCNQATIEFVFQNPLGYDHVDWSGDVGVINVGGGRLDGAGNLANSPAVTSRTVTLTRNILPGETLTITLDADGSQTDSASVVAAKPCVSGGASVSAGTSSGSTSSGVPVPPCKLNDGRVDPSCGAPIATYVQQADDACYINVYSGYGATDGRVRLVLAVPLNAVEDVPALPETNMLIDSGEYGPLGTIALYRLTTGEFQLNVGPYGDAGNVYVLNFSGCDATGAYTTNSYQTQG